LKISAEQVEQVATLARLGLDRDEIEPLRRQLEAILDYVEQLETLELAEVEPTTHVLPLDCPLREDQSRPSPMSRSIVAQAPQAQDNLFAVPRIIRD
jgi:aspartyl-tRNA(Asn)/glutamyl-tRNA(Gln) amidotransferase subunit C